MTGSKMSSHSYWTETRRPVYSLVFLLPIIALYEAGIFLISTSDREAIRNGADQIVQGVLHYVGVREFFICSGVFVIFILLILQTKSASPWKVRPLYLAAMTVEALCYPFLLILFALAFSASVTKNSMGPENMNLYTQIILSLGAGIYEEFVFRLLLIGLFSIIFRTLLPLSRAESIIVAALISSIIFSLCHYIGPYGDVLEMKSFLYRTAAGIVLGAIYITRGLAVAAGTHAAYDIIVLAILQKAVQ